MTTLTAFLLDRITEDEAVAQAPDPSASPEVLTDMSRIEYDYGPVGYARIGIGRALAECEAKRRIVELHSANEAPDLTDEELHERRTHPEWEYLTVETGRKTDEDTSPPDETWEPNAAPDWVLPDGSVVPGRNWERFEYTEETYYRRRRTGGPAPAPASPTLLALAQVYSDHPDYDPTWAISE